MSIGFALMPYPGEILYSWVVRFNKHSAYNRDYATSETLFEYKRHTKSLRYTNCINNLSSLLDGVEGFSIDEIINNMTILSMCKPFVSEDRYQSIRHNYVFQDKANKASNVFHFNGLYKEERSKVKVCPLCVAEDKENYGEAFLHTHHNVIGVRTCYLHGCYLDYIEHKFCFYQPFYDVDERYAPNAIKYPIKKDIELHKRFNSDVKFILDGKFRNVTLGDIYNKVQNKLKLLGILNRRNAINHPILNGFLDYFGKDFLNYYELNGSLVDELKWLWRILHCGKNSIHRERINPILYIFALNYLFGSLESFVNFEDVYAPFGIGPYPCNNNICKYYHQNIIESYEITITNDAKHVTGHFTCKLCGFSYRRSSRHETGCDPYSYLYVNDYGETWKDKLKSLILSENYNISEIAKVMNCSNQAIVKHANSMGIGNILGTKSNLRYLNEDQKLERVKERAKGHKERIVEYLLNNPNKLRVEINREMKSEVDYLMKYDKPWLENHLPESQRRKKHSDYFREKHWYKREKFECSKVIKIVEELLEDKERKRITKELLAKRSGYTGIKRKNALINMPKLAEIINSVTESHDEYLKRINLYTCDVIKKNE